MDNFFKKLRLQLFVIFILPALGLLYFSSHYVASHYNRYEESLILGERVSYARYVMDVTQALQRERGLSLACIDEASFCSLLQKQRKLTDQSLQRYFDFVSQSDRYKGVVEQLQKLALLRKQADEGTLSSIATLEGYSKLIEGLLRSINVLEQKFIDERVFKTTFTFTKILELTEINGQERALFAFILGKQGVDEELVKRLRILLANEESVRKILFETIPTEILVQYRKILPLDDEKRFCDLKEQILETKNFRAISKQQWWKESTAYIDRLYAIDRKIADDLLQLKSYYMQKARKSLWFSIALWVVSFAALLLFVEIFRKFLRLYQKRIAQVEYENRLVQVVAELSEDVLFIDNINALLSTFSSLLGRIESFSFHYIVDCRAQKVVATEGISAAYIDTYEPARLKALIEEVRKSRNGRVAKLYEEKFKDQDTFLLQPIVFGECLYLVVAAVSSETGLDEKVLDTINKMCEIFIFAYEQIELKEEEQKLKEELRLLSGAFNSHEAITITDAEGKILRVNKAFEKITGYKEEEVLGKTPAVLKSGKHGKEFYQQMWDAIRHNGYWKGEIYNKRKDGTIYPEILSITALTNEQGEVTNYVAHFFDISDMKEAQKEIERRANHDILTDLINRRRLLEELNFIRAAALREGFYNAFFFIDLDNFKYVNDSFGHSVGDRVLIEVAKTLKRFQRKEDLVARIAGDEFAFVASSIGRSEEEASKRAAILAEKFIQAFNRPIVIDGHEIDLGVSIGIAIFPTTDRSAEEVVTNADIAMYHSKKNGKNTFSFYNERLDIESKRYLLMKNEIKEGLERGEFEIYYQPKFDVKKLQLVGFEALLRWNSKNYGLLYPDRFLQYAYGNKLIYEISDFVIEQVKNQLLKWKEKECEVAVSINLSADQFNNNRYMFDLLDRFDGEWAKNVILEIVEDAFVREDLEYTLELIKLYKERGVRFSIDDFGAGYTSLSYLRRLPVYEVKIDKGFVIDLFKDHNDKIVDMVVDIGHSFGFKVTAEGVESEAHLEFLQKIGCDYFQGFYMSRAVPAKEAERFFDSWCRGTDGAD